MAELKRVAGKWTVLALTISTITGTGIFFGPAIAASYAGVASILSWVILSVIAVYIGLCFGELIAMFPKAGGVYEFGKQSYGRFISFIIGWVAWLVGNITTVVLIVAAIDYLLPSPGLVLIKMIACMFFVLLLNTIAFLGMQESSIAMVIFLIITAIVFIVVIVSSFFLIKPANLTTGFNINVSSIFIAIFFKR